ncbi:MAG: bifunctional DNA-formamidopyrimidine glycosylase/DNA-(apurinic or apyrimidinic site) lyase [Pseudomonadales bacterium]|nr:bifunctional DNA-formamidopyrimidine glycosylase/DNA-(apurinic or apyrimidinic site) lyase [Pseudomonadales bacterium]
MPELPEVETTRRGIEPYVVGQFISGVRVRHRQLRWPIPDDLNGLLKGQQVLALTRRGKYLLFEMSAGTLLVHLGMSGSLRLVSDVASVGAHDHLDIMLGSGQVLRYTDPRRFGAILWTEQDPMQHSLLSALGPEPLQPEFDGDYLYRQSRQRTCAVKSFIMDGHVVVGVGNIYACEALFTAGIHPKRAAGRISLLRYRHLAEVIKTVLEQAIAQGGTTLRDFVGGDGKPGYFKQSLKVYGRGGMACQVCNLPLREIRLGQRTTVYCWHCQH